LLRFAMASRVGSAAHRSSTPVPKAVAAAGVKGVSNATSGVTSKKDTTEAPKLMKISDDALRAGFVRKVYGLLAAQLVMTVIIAGICMHVPVIQGMFVAVARAQTWWLQLAFMVPPSASLLVLSMGVKDKYPANYIFLFIFTVGIAVQLGFLCSVFQGMGHGHLVLQAAAATAAIFIGLSMYAVCSGKDFSYMRGFLYTMLWGLVIVGFGAVIFPWLGQSLLLGYAGAFTFCGYIVYDTWRIQKKCGYDDYIGATIQIYLDIVNLFIHILEITAAFDKKDKKRK
jgi:hypothetical protein